MTHTSTDQKTCNNKLAISEAYVALHTVAGFGEIWTRITHIATIGLSGVVGCCNFLHPSSLAPVIIVDLTPEQIKDVQTEG